MGLADRDYTNRDNTNRNYGAKIQYTQNVSNIIQKSSLLCDYCKKEIEIKLVTEKQTRSKIERGLVIDEIIEVVVERQNSLICSTCGGAFCPECIKSYYKDKNSFVLTNICKGCEQKSEEKLKKECSHKYLKSLIRSDEYFDYFEIECIYCGNKKGIAEPIKKIGHEPEPKQKGIPQTKPKSKNKGISKILNSVKRTFR
ncbi:hypothetical protein [Methanolobus chelungpuianus]|uniref:Uncharacterized protein n=1 Tax=Methanolobus chelungpuianus TaxID=502115 RepID=A0AAE3HC59_9EURY|nr:hypothetical protein [Methanolobus chelungpuianus]MCQ6963552.1 hypothetical protein [Methanolobus chelungpuianus]